MAIAYDATSQGRSNGTTSLTFSHTCTGSDRVLVVGTNHRNVGGDVTGVTYNGVALTQINTGQANSNNLLRLWYLVAPATGANNVVVSLSASLRVVALSVSYTGVDSGTPIGTSAKAASLSTTVTSATSELVVGIVGSEGAGGTVVTYNGGTGTTERNEYATTVGSNDACMAVGEEAGAASVTFSWSIASGSSNGDGIIGVPLKPAAASTDVLIQGLHGIERGMMSQTAARLGGILQG